MSNMASTSRSADQAVLPANVEAPRQLCVHAARPGPPSSSLSLGLGDAAIPGQVFKASKERNVRRVRGAAVWYAPFEGEVRVVDSSTSEALSTYLLPAPHSGHAYTNVAPHLPSLISSPLVLFNAPSASPDIDTDSKLTHAYLPARKGEEYGVMQWIEKGGTAERSWISLHKPAAHLALLSATVLLALHADGSQSLADLSNKDMHFVQTFLPSLTSPSQTHSVLAVLAGKSAWDRFPPLKPSAGLDESNSKALVFSLCGTAAPEVIGAASAGKRRGKGHKRDKREEGAPQVQQSQQSAESASSRKKSKTLILRIHIVDPTACRAESEAQGPNGLLADLPIQSARADELLSMSLSSDAKSLVTLSIQGVLQQYTLNLSTTSGASSLVQSPTLTMIRCPSPPTKMAKDAALSSTSSKVKSPSLPAGTTMVHLPHDHVLFVLPPSEGTSTPQPGAYLISLVLGAVLDYEPTQVPGTSGAQGQTSLSIRAARIGGGVLLTQTRVHGTRASMSKKHKDSSAAVGSGPGECRVASVPVDVPNAASIKWAIGQETRAWTNALLWPPGTPISVSLSTLASAKASHAHSSTDPTAEKHELVVALRAADSASAKDDVFKAWYDVEKGKIAQAEAKAARTRTSELAHARKVAARRNRQANSGTMGKSEDEEERDVQMELERLMLQKERETDANAKEGKMQGTDKQQASRPALPGAVVRLVIEQAFAHAHAPNNPAVASTLVHHLMLWRMLSASQVLQLSSTDEHDKQGESRGLIARLLDLQEWDLALLAATNVSDVQEFELVLLLLRSFRAERGRKRGDASSNKGVATAASPARVLAVLTSRPELIDSAAFKHALLKSQLTDADRVADLLARLHDWLAEGFINQTSHLGKGIKVNVNLVPKLKKKRGNKLSHTERAHDENKIVRPGVDECLTMLTVLLDVYFPLLLQSPTTWSVLTRLSKTLSQLLRSSNALKNLLGPLSAFQRLSSDLSHISKFSPNQHHPQHHAAAANASVTESERQTSARRTAVAAVDLRSAPTGVKETGGGLGHANLIAAKTAHRTGEARKGDSVRVKAIQESALVGPYTVERLAF
ncbi:hypothetical protein IE81DRAFT_366919 [Ceraceosorus guamensis]|uniref:Uncharacterized protein n=1 Tax=Ceraceosorus guamensis TaxID=1522189 RepID=A0A316VX42_9BASI|nr:hypothetical protein IE81DRAFT_366919 [Ceraceosorus guamensis]PWN42029.1 hypothetical protein IE81DRAFT_366919 [Ceraceosorus guamensis]